MKTIRLLLLSALLAFFDTAASAPAPASAPGAVPASAPGSALVYCSEPCNSLVRQALALEGQGQYQEAMDRYQAAEKADPKASLPLSLPANLVFRLSNAAPKDKAGPMRDMARALAERATAVASDDPVAHEVLRMLDDNGLSPLHTPNPRANKLMAEGATLFSQGKPNEALAKYEAAMQADPKASGAWVGAADCYFMQRDWGRAQALFQRATEIEPDNAQAWRFLSDALLAQGQRAQAEAALHAAIAADPSQRPNWGKLANLRAAAGLPLKALAFKRGMRVVQGADGKFTINIDKSTAETRKTPDGAIRLVLAMSELDARKSDTAKARPPFEIELASWRNALAVMEEVGASGKDAVTDPALLQMQALAKDGQLEAAILLLMFRQAYRPALQAWLAANPGGVKAFIDRYGLQP